MAEFTLVDLIAVVDAPHPDPAQQAIWEHTNGVNVLGLTLDGEGRGEALQGRAAIAWTVRNRREKYRADLGKPYHRICLRRLQYSCWWPQGDTSSTISNYDRTMLMTESIYGTPKAVISNMASARLSESLWVAQGVIGGQIQDPTNGATHYCTLQAYNSGAVSWAVPGKITVKFGAHVFFAGIA